MSTQLTLQALDKELRNEEPLPEAEYSVVPKILPSQTYFDLARERSELVLQQLAHCSEVDEICQHFRQSPMLETLVGNAQERFMVAQHFFDGERAQCIDHVLGQSDALKFALIEGALQSFQSDRRAQMRGTLL